MKKKILILGLGISGRSAANLLLNQGASVAGLDSNRTLVEIDPAVAALKQRGLQAFYDVNQVDLTQYESIVVSPGIPNQHPIYLKAKAAGIELIGEVELACRFLKATRFLGITGTNGKTTVTLLVTHILNQSGKPARALGNVGVALTSEEAFQAASSNEIIVLELSSYQLETLHSKILDAAVLLNITPDHLDRYGNMEAYAKAKFLIAGCLKLAAPLFIEKRCYDDYRNLIDFPACTYGYEQDCTLFCDLKTVFLNSNRQFAFETAFAARSHDLENILAAYALCHSQGVTPEQFIEGLKTFKKPSHRIEFVREREKVLYYDDSKGTNLDAVIRAVDSLPHPIILIAGGVDKGAPYTPWIEAFKHKVKQICAIGQAASKIEKDIGHSIPVTIHASLEDAIKQASHLAQSGDCVLLSPGCSSFDMFKDYAHRGKEFQRIVRALA